MLGASEQYCLAPPPHPTTHKTRGGGPGFGGAMLTSTRTRCASARPSHQEAGRGSESRACAFGKSWRPGRGDGRPQAPSTRDRERSAPRKRLEDPRREARRWFRARPCRPTSKPAQRWHRLPAARPRRASSPKGRGSRRRWQSAPVRQMLRLERSGDRPWPQRAAPPLPQREPASHPRRRARRAIARASSFV